MVKSFSLKFFIFLFEQQLVKKLKNRRRPFPFDVKMYVRVKRVENAQIARVTMFSIERSLSCKDTNNTRRIKGKLESW